MSKPRTFKTGTKKTMPLVEPAPEPTANESALFVPVAEEDEETRAASLAVRGARHERRPKRRVPVKDRWAVKTQIQYANRQGERCQAAAGAILHSNEIAEADLESLLDRDAVDYHFQLQEVD